MKTTNNLEEQILKIEHRLWNISVDHKSLIYKIEHNEDSINLIVVMSHDETIKFSLYPGTDAEFYLTVDQYRISLFLREIKSKRLMSMTFDDIETDSSQLQFLQTMLKNRNNIGEFK